MTIASTTNRVSYTGNGATSVYAYTFKIFDEDDLLVTVKDTATPPVETTLTKTTDYTVSDVGETSGGNVTLVDASQAWLDGDGDLLTNYVLTIRRVVDLLQNTDIRNQGSFFPETHEDEFDLLVMADQQQQDEIDRALKLPETVTSSDFDPTLPTDIATADGILVVNSGATAFEIDTSIGTGSKQVSVSSNDTSKGYLNGKLVAGDNIAFTENNDGSAETLTIALDVITNLQINDTSSDHQYILAVSELAADRTITLPLLTGNDEFVFKDHAVTMANKTLTSPVLNTSISGTAFLDEDNMASDSATKVASQQSIKAYADTKLPEPTGNGIAVRTGADAATNRTITATADETSVSNGDGVSGNPVIGIADNPVLPGTGAVQVPSGTTAQRPGSPTDGDFRYNSTTGKFEGYQNSAWGELGSGSGVNYISDSNAEGGVGSWATYADAAGTDPVDGTGSGSETITWTQNTTTPLRDVADFKFTKDAADRQGEGASYDFTIDRADLASVLRIEFDYDASDTDYADDDIRIMIYDKDGSALIEPVSRDLKAGKGKFVAYFQSDSANDDYRLIIHQSSTNAAAYDIYFDNIKVGPANRTYSTPVSDWKAYTPGCSWVTNVAVTGFWRRVGDTMEVQARVECSGAPTAADLTFDLPSGYTVDTAKLELIDADDDWAPIGQASFIEAGVQGYFGHVGYVDTNTVRVKYGVASQAYHASVNATAPFTFGNNDAVIVKFAVPISGWGSQVQMSDDADTRVIATRYGSDAGQTISSGSFTIVDFEDKSFDTHNAVTTGGSWNFAAPSSGKYKVSTKVLWASASFTAGDNLELRLYKNGSADSVLDFKEFQATSTVAYGMNGSITIDLVAGDTLDIRLFQNSGTNKSLGNNSLDNYISIDKIQGPSAIAANELVAGEYTLASAQTLTTGTLTTISNMTTKVEDTHGSFSAGVFTTPVAGRYQFNLSLRFTTNATGSRICGLLVNGSTEIYLDWDDASASGQAQCSGSKSLKLNAGDTVAIRGWQTSGGNLDVETNINGTRFDFYRVGF